MSRRLMLDTDCDKQHLALLKSARVKRTRTGFQPQPEGMISVRNSTNDNLKGISVMGRIAKPGKFSEDRQLQRCAESGTSRICIPLAFQSLTAAVRGVPFEIPKDWRS